jgi:hypothetical protein
MKMENCMESKIGNDLRPDQQAPAKQMQAAEWNGPRTYDNAAVMARDTLRVVLEYLLESFADGFVTAELERRVTTKLRDDIADLEHRIAADRPTADLTPSPQQQENSHAYTP